MPRSLVPEGVLALSADPTGVRAGQTYWNTATATLRTFNGTTWVNVGPYALPGNPSFSTVTATSTASYTATSTTHALTLGQSNSGQLVADNFGLQTRLAGNVNTTLQLNRLGGAVTVNSDLAKYLNLSGDLLRSVDKASFTLAPLRLQGDFNGTGGMTTIGLQHVFTDANLSTNKVVVSAAPTAAGDVTRKDYVDSAIAAKTSFDGIDLTSATALSLSSATHPLRIGPSTAANLGLDRDSVQARSNGAAANLYLQEFGGDTIFGTGETRVLSSGQLSTSRVLLTNPTTVQNEAARKDYVDAVRSDSDIMNIMGAF